MAAPDFWGQVLENTPYCTDCGLRTLSRCPGCISCEITRGKEGEFLRKIYGCPWRPLCLLCLRIQGKCRWCKYKNHLVVEKCRRHLADRLMASVISGTDMADPRIFKDGHQFYHGADLVVLAADDAHYYVPEINREWEFPNFLEHIDTAWRNTALSGLEFKQILGPAYEAPRKN
jgi:hypothetical protein